MIPTRTAAAHTDLAQHRCPLMSLVHPQSSGADPPKWLGADQSDHRLRLLLSTCLILPTGAWPANFLRLQTRMRPISAPRTIAFELLFCLGSGIGWWEAPHFPKH